MCTNGYLEEKTAASDVAANPGFPQCWSYNTKSTAKSTRGGGGGLVGHVQKQPRAFADRGLRPFPPQVRWPSVSVSDIHIYVFLYVLLTRHNSPNSDIKPNSDKIIFGLNAP